MRSALLLPGLVLWTWIATAVGPSVARAAEPPFAGVVANDEVLVRSGADEDYYPTMKLGRGTPLNVVREDFGWYVIEPPTGSYSWVNADHVERRAGNRGIVTTDTWDRLGSDLDISDKEPVRHRLAKRETVEILGEAEVTTERGKVKMLKIKPPLGEYRYIRKGDVEPANAASPKADELPLALTEKKKPAASKPESKAGQGGDEKPIASLLPTNDNEGVPTPKVAQETPAAMPETKGTKPTEAVASSEIPPGHIDANVRLKQIDDEFRVMAEKPAANWNLASIRDQYNELRGHIEDADFRREVDKRLAAVGRYQTRYNDFIAVQQIMKETEARDEQIRQQFLQGRQSVAMQTPVTTHVSRSNQTPTSGDPFAQPTPPPATQPQPGMQPRQPQPQAAQQPQQWPYRPQANWGATQPQAGRPSLPGLQPAPSTGSSFMTPPMLPRKYDGAGIVQRSALNRPGWPQHVLIAPDGRVLTYLQAGPGVDLDRYVGMSMGMIGQRGFRQDLNADLLVVRQAAPVRLKTGP